MSNIALVNAIDARDTRLKVHREDSKQAFYFVPKIL